MRYQFGTWMHILYFTPYQVVDPARARGCLICTHFHGQFYGGHLLCERDGGRSVAGVPAPGVHSGCARSEQMTSSAGKAIRYAPLRPNDLAPRDPRFETLFSLPYRQARRALARVPGNAEHPRYPRFQYKYRAPLSKPEHADHLRDLAVVGRFWLSSPRDFNDPFDMTARLSMESTASERRARFIKMVGQFSKSDRKGRREEVRRFMARPLGEWQRAMQSTMDKHLDSFGVFSFAGDPRSILMWSHYARDHTGFCLQFEVARDARALTEAVPVKYVEDYPVYRWAGDEEQIRSALIHKFKQWEYEKEWRIPWAEGAHTYVRFNPAALSDVIFGMRASDPMISQVRAVLGERPAGLPPVVSGCVKARIFDAGRNAGRVRGQRFQNGSSGSKGKTSWRRSRRRLPGWRRRLRSARSARWMAGP